MIQYRSLSAGDINRSLFGGFVRRQAVVKCWRKENGKWVVREDPFIDDWPEQDYRHLIGHLKGLLSSGGFVYAALLGETLKRFVSVDAIWIQKDREYLDLTNLHVSEELRGNGIGRRLFLAAAEWAQETGDKKALSLRAFSR